MNLIGTAELARELGVTAMTIIRDIDHFNFFLKIVRLYKQPIQMTALQADKLKIIRKNFEAGWSRDDQFEEYKKAGFIIALAERYDKRQSGSQLLSMVTAMSNDVARLRMENTEMKKRITVLEKAAGIKNE